MSLLVPPFQTVLPQKGNVLINILIIFLNYMSFSANFINLPKDSNQVTLLWGCSSITSVFLNFFVFVPPFSTSIFIAPPLIHLLGPCQNIPLYLLLGLVSYCYLNTVCYCIISRIIFTLHISYSFDLFVSIKIYCKHRSSSAW